MSVSLAALAEEDLATKQVELKKGDRIIFFGDSLTNLAGEEKPKEHVTKGYVRIVRETLQEKHKDKKIEVDWVATGGHTVPDLLKRVDSRRDRQKADDCRHPDRLQRRPPHPQGNVPDQPSGEPQGKLAPDTGQQNAWSKWRSKSMCRDGPAENAGSGLRRLNGRQGRIFPRQTASGSVKCESSAKCQVIGLVRLQALRLLKNVGDMSAQLSRRGWPS